MNILQRFSNAFFGSRKSGMQSAEFTYEVEPVGFHTKHEHGSSIANQAVDKVAKAVASMQFKAIDDAGEVVQSNIANALLSIKNNESFDDVMHNVASDLHYGGYSLLVFVGNTKIEPIKVEYVNPIKASIFRDTNNDIERIEVNNDIYSGVYYLRDGRFLDVTSDFKELILIKNRSDMPILKSVETELAILSDGLRRNGALLQNSGRLSMVFSYQDHATPEQVEARASSINRMVRGKNFGGIMVTSGQGSQVDIKEFGLSPKDMDFTSLYDLCRKEVFLNCGVPLPLVSSESSTYNNVVQSETTFYTNTVIPMTNLIYDRIARAYNRRTKQPIKLVVDDAEVWAIKMQSAEVVKVLDESKSITINEKRAILGYEPIQNGDDLLVESRFVPLDGLGVTQ